MVSKGFASVLMSNFVDKLIFNYKNDECYIGCTNDTKITPSGITDPDFKGSVVIPKYHNGKPISYIGYWAFYGCYYITEVKIEARVKAIYKYAFGHLPNLWHINVPSSCTFLGSQSIYSFNNSNMDYPNAAGILIISFDPGSQLETIDNNAFGRKERIVLIMCERIRSLKSVHKDFYYKISVTYFEIYSPYSFSVGGIATTIKKSLFCHHRTCNNMKRSRSFNISFLLVSVLLS